MITVNVVPDWLDYAAAGATAISAGVIAWQAWLTRRTLKSTEASVQIAQDGLKEARFVRLDANVPRLHFEVDKPAGAFRVFGWDRDESVNLDDVTLKMPKDGDDWITFDLPARIHNDGPWSASVELNHIFTPVDATRWGKKFMIPPGTTLIGAINLNSDVSYWVEAAQHEVQESKTFKPLRITATYSGNRDSDVDEIHSFTLLGSPIAAVEKQLGDWRARGRDDFNSGLRLIPHKVERVYWRSRKAGTKY